MCTLLSAFLRVCVCVCVRLSEMEMERARGRAYFLLENERVANERVAHERKSVCAEAEGKEWYTRP